MSIKPLKESNLTISTWYQSIQNTFQNVFSASTYTSLSNSEDEDEEEVEEGDRHIKIKQNQVEYYSDDNNTSHISSEENSRWCSKELIQQLIAWTSMIMAIISGASVGPAFRYMMIHGVKPLLAASWRGQAMFLVLLPVAVFEAVYKPENRVDWFGYKHDLPYPVIIHVIISGLGWSSNLLFWIVGLKFISTYKAAIVATCHPILLVFTMKFHGSPVSFLEWLGVFVSFAGMFFSNCQSLFLPETSSTNEESNDLDHISIHYQLLGIFLCLLSAAGEVLVIYNRIKTRQYVPLLQYTTGTTLVVAIVATFTSILLEGTHTLQLAQIHSNRQYHLCYDVNCSFGWISHDWIYKMLVFGLWIGAVCITGLNYAMQYIPPLVFSSLSLLDPAICAIFSWLIGVEALPTIFAWFGGLIVIAGVGIISKGEANRKKEEEQALINIGADTSTFHNKQIIQEIELKETIADRLELGP